ncbi:MAG: MGMT family protein [Dermatophilaceae bacterium]
MGAELGRRLHTGPMDRLPDEVERVLELVEDIPPGAVVTYGQLAGMAGSGARRVGTVLSRYGSDVPWWRVVRAGGLPPRGLAPAAREHYLHEGTPLVEGGPGGYRVDLGRARWDAR